MSLADGLRLVAAQIAQILKGAKPADLPVLQPTRFQLVIKTPTGGLIPGADTSLIAGKKSSAKSPFAYHLIACATANKEFAEGVTIEHDVVGGMAMLFTSERDLEERVLPRLEMAGVNMEKVIVVPFENAAGDKTQDCDTLAKVRAKYEETLTALKAHYEQHAPHLIHEARIPLVIVEMLDDYEEMAYTRKRPSELLRPFHHLAKKNGTAFVFFVHLLEKGSGAERSFAAMIQGRSGWVRAASTIWGMAMKDQLGVVELCITNLGTKGQRWSYTTEGRVNHNRPELNNETIPVLVMGDVARRSVMEMLRELDKGTEQPTNESVRDKFKTWFLHWLAEGTDVSPELATESAKQGVGKVEGCRASVDIPAAAEAAGFSPKSKTIQRAREDLKRDGVITDIRVGNKYWVVLRKPLPPITDDDTPLPDQDMKAETRPMMH